MASAAQSHVDVENDPPLHVSLFIDGQDIEATDGFEVRNPADTADLVGVCALAGAEHVEVAVAAAQAASAQWSRVAVHERAAALDAFAAQLRCDLDASARLLCREHGKTLTEARAEFVGAAGIVAWHAEQSDALAPQDVSDHRGRMIRQWVPMGVVAVIVPWNYPVLLAQLMIAPALLAGNAVVVKLPDHAPLALGSQLRTFAATLPAGVLNIIAGDGTVVGEALTSHPLVRKVAFTGSTATGRAIMRSASSTLKSLSLELGGNDPAIILPGSSITDELANELLVGALTSAGQVCYAPKRIYVHRGAVEDLREAMVRAGRDIVVGNGLDPEVTMGPLNNAEQWQIVHGLLDDAMASRATVTPLGRVADRRPDSGLFFQPHLVTDLDNDAALVREEQFGPLIPLIAYDTVEEAVAAANDSEYGLAASVWSDDPDEAFAVAGQLQAGSVFVNIHRVGASGVDMPFGGFKQSGLGRGHGVEGIREYTELQIVAQRQDMRSAQA